MKKILLIAMLIPACTPEQRESSWVYDQCYRAQLFKDCLERIPKGPEKIQAAGNDWSEVVEECQNAAQYASVRKRGMVKPECSSD